MRERLSATVESELLDAARAAVEAGRAASVSDWVNQALHRQADHDRRMAALDRFIAAYETEHGEITDDEMQAARRSARADAVRVSGRGDRQFAKKRRGVA